MFVNINSLVGKKYECFQQKQVIILPVFTVFITFQQEVAVQRGMYTSYVSDQILQLCATLIPFSNPRGEIEAQVDADRSQRQWFKGQNQQQHPPSPAAAAAPPSVKMMLTGTPWWEAAGMFVE